MALVREALKLLNGGYAAPGKGATFQALKASLDPIDTKNLPSYEEAAALLKVSVASVTPQDADLPSAERVYRFCPGGDQLHRFELR